MNNALKTNSTFSDDCENVFAKEETISRLLKLVGLSGYKVSRVDRTYTIGQDRNGVVVILKDKSTQRLLKATIDFKQGTPSWQQMMDLTFGIGEGSDIRIAVYDQPDRDDGSEVGEEDEYIAGSFVSVLKGSGLNAHLVKMTVTLREGRIPHIAFRPVPEEYLSEISLKNLPSRSEFEQGEFWVFYFDQLYPADPPISMQPDLWFGDIGSIVYGSAITSTSWNDRGVFLEAIFETPEQIETLKRLWETKRAELLDHYRGCDVHIDKGVKGSQKLVVRLSCIPFRDFVLSDREVKQTLADLYLYGDWEFVTFMGELVSDMKLKPRSETGEMKEVTCGDHNIELHEVISA
jgi:hypothetical protein